MFVHQVKILPSLQRIPACLSYCSTATAAAYQHPIVPSSNFRTSEINTASFSDVHNGKFYTIKPEDKKQLFASGGLPGLFEKNIKTFAETCLMVRSPALEVIDYIKRTDFSRPTVRYLIYGDNGTGKTLSMAHIVHYGFQNGFVLVHVPWVPNWMKRPKEMANDSLREGFIDLPFDAAAWLVHFKTQNATLLSKLDLKTSKDYEWSKREVTPAGSTITELIEHGIARVKFASGTIAALLSELKQQATNGKCKVMVAIDGYNAFFHPITRILTETKQIVTPDRVSLTQPFLDITNYDWTNGVCIMSVDKIGMTEGFMDSYLPRYLLGKDGFEHLDPFVPIHVTNYTEKEFTSCINYYIDRHWIQKKVPGFDEQLKFMSNKNPFNLMHLTRRL